MEDETQPSGAPRTLGQRMREKLRDPKRRRACWCTYVVFMGGFLVIWSLITVFEASGFFSERTSDCGYGNVMERSWALVGVYGFGIAAPFLFFLGLKHRLLLLCWTGGCVYLSAFWTVYIDQICGYGIGAERIAVTIPFWLAWGVGMWQSRRRSSQSALPYVAQMLGIMFVLGLLSIGAFFAARELDQDEHAYNYLSREFRSKGWKWTVDHCSRELEKGRARRAHLFFRGVGRFYLKDYVGAKADLLTQCTEFGVPLEGNELLDFTPQDGDVLFFLGCTHIELDEHDKAKLYLESAASSNQFYFFEFSDIPTRSNFMLAVIALQAADLSLALQHVENAIEACERNPKLLETCMELKENLEECKREEKRER